MKYNSFVREHRDITMSGNKRYEDKSGEYYLQNLGKFQKINLNFNQKSITSLNINNNNLFNKNIDNNYLSNKHIIKVKKKNLFDELIPIPNMKQKNKIKNDIEKKNLNNAMDNAKYIRRFQYSNNISKKQIQQYKEMKKSEKIFFEKIKFIQIWWKTIFQIIKIQKYLRGYLYKIKLISLLDQREKYIDKVLNLVKCSKKLLLYKYFNNLYMYNNYKKFYFNKWNEIINKKNIIIKLKKNYSSFKLFDKEYKDNNNNFIKITESNYKAYNKQDDIDLEDIENDIFKFKNINNNKNNKSLIEIYTNNINKSKKNNDIRREHNLSSSSFILRPRKVNLNIGNDLSSSQILKRRRKNSIYDNNQINYNKNNNQCIYNKKINIFDNIIKSDNKRNNNKNIIKYKKESNNNKIKTNIKGIYQKEKSFNDLKIKKNFKNNYNNLNKNITSFNDNKNKYNNNNDLTKSTNINSFNKNIRLSAGGQNKMLKSKNNLNLKKKMHKFTDSNLSNYSNNLFSNNKNNNNKIKKKKKVYENKLNYYSKKLNLENNEKEYLSIDKDNNNILEKIQPYTESIFDESQFSAILDNSTLNNNKNTISYNNEDEKSISNKKIRSNSCIDVDSLILQKSNKNNDILRKYFTEWSKKTELILILKKLYIKKNIFSAEKILIKIIAAKLYRIFLNKYKDYYFYFINLNKINSFFNVLKIKKFIKEIKCLCKKCLLLKYFNAYKDIICKRIMIENIIKNKKNNIKKKNKGIKKRNKKQIFYSDSNLGNNDYNGFLTEFPFNKYKNNYINNSINLNNNTNNCYIINNLNYNDNTNKINIGLTYQNDLYNNNYNIKKQNNINSFGIIRSKFIEFPEYLNQQKKIKQSVALYNLNNNNNVFKENFNNSIDNFNLLNYYTNSNAKNGNKGSIVYKHNLSKSVILSNNIDYLKPDITTQKNQLTMVINIVERRRKLNKFNISFSFFKKWKDLSNNNNIYPKSNDNKRNMRNKKHIIDTLNSFKNKNKTNLIINFSDNAKDLEELTGNTINTEGFHTESDTKSENKMPIKSIKIISSKNLFPDNNKGIYKKKTIGPNKALNFIGKNKNKINVSNINNYLNQNNDLKLNNVRLSTNIISHNYDIQDFNKEDFENKYIKKPLSDKNLNLYLKKNNDSNENKEDSDNINNIAYYSPEEYLGFKKANKIEEMEISFFPINDNKINTNFNDTNKNNNKYMNSFNNHIKEKEFGEIDKKEVIIEAIEEYNEYDENKENMIQKIKSEFINSQPNFLYRTFSNLKIKFNIDLFEEQKENISYITMSDIV